MGPAPGASTETPSSRGFARSMRDNALGIFPPQAFEEEVVFRKFFGRQQIIISRPAAIQQILVDNPGNYRRTAAGIRILRPLLGRGLLLSRGEDWRHQRRTLAPAFAPRTMPILARHVAKAAGAAAASLRAACAAPVDLLAAMQFLALEIAGASMFSLEMERYGAELRGLIKHYAAHLGRPSLFDFLLPPEIPSIVAAMVVGVAVMPIVFALGYEVDYLVKAEYERHVHHKAHRQAKYKPERKKS
jgi:cytochrome P450